MKRAIMLDRKPLQELLLLDEESIVSEVLSACLMYDATGSYKGVFSKRGAEEAFSSLREGLDEHRADYAYKVKKAKEREERRKNKRKECMQ